MPIEVKQRPILFSTPMVQAILEGRKTMTRRTNNLDVINEVHNGKLMGEWALSKHLGILDGVSKWNIQTDVDDYTTMDFKCLYGKVGDIIWVRETWCRGCTINRDDEKSDMRYYYKADTDWQEHEWDHPTKEGPQDSPVWKPSIHMPKKACRIFLEITDVKIERLQEISEQDSIAEGVLSKPAFYGLWQSINGIDSLFDNPFVWVISFKRIDKIVPIEE